MIFERSTSFFNFFHYSRSVLIQLPGDEILEWFYEYVSQFSSELNSQFRRYFDRLILFSDFFPAQNWAPSLL